MSNFLLNEETPACGEVLSIVVRKRTEEYFNGGEAVYRVRLSLLKKKSVGDLGDIMVENEEVSRITNLHSVEDGVYYLTWTNVVRDYETGYAEDWDYTLIPYEEE